MTVLCDSVASCALLVVLDGVTLVGVERAAWTDQRLDDLSRTGWTRASRESMPTYASFGPEIGRLRTILLRVGGGIMIGLVGLVGVILVGPAG